MNARESESRAGPAPLDACCPLVGARDVHRRGGGYRATLRSKSFRYLLGGFALEQAGQSLGALILVIMVYRSTQSAALASVVVGVRLLPYVVGAPCSGVLADVLDRQRVLRWSLTLRMIASLCLAALIASSSPVVTWLIAFGVLVLCGTGTYPIAMAAVPGLVEPRDRTAANSLVTSVASCLFAVVPGVGLAMFALVPASLMFVLAGSMFAACLLLFRHVNFPLQATAPLRGNICTILRAVPRELGRGVTLVVRSRAALAVHVLLITTNIMEGAAVVLLLAYVTRGDQVDSYGSCMLAMSIGAGASLIVAPRVGRKPLPALVVSVLTAGTGLSLLAWTQDMRLACAILIVVGLALMLSETLAASVLQGAVSPRHTSRAFGLLDAVMVGGVFIGSAIASPLEAATGLASSLVLIGLVLPIGLATVVWPTTVRSSAPAGWTRRRASQSMEIAVETIESMLRTEPSNSADRSSALARRGGVAGAPPTPGSSCSSDTPNRAASNACDGPPERRTVPRTEVRANVVP